ncbi:MAG: hypothetical protein HC767_10550 [Akkermansiaceae bacterium]|nr:hypothetical protein [Akkermansiaceae bacterium]
MTNLNVLKASSTITEAENFLLGDHTSLKAVTDGTAQQLQTFKNLHSFAANAVQLLVQEIHLILYWSIRRWSREQGWGCVRQVKRVNGLPTLLLL